MSDSEEPTDRPASKETGNAKSFDVHKSASSPQNTPEYGVEKPKFRVTRSPFAQRAEDAPAPAVQPKSEPPPEKEAKAPFHKPMVGKHSRKPAAKVNQAPFASSSPAPTSAKTVPKPKAAPAPRAKQEKQPATTAVGLSVDVIIAILAVAAAALIIINLVK